MPTVETSSTPYCTPARLLIFINWTIVAMALQDDEDAPRPQRAELLDSTTPSPIYTLLNDLCMGASGELESACLARELYSVEDLQALTGATKAHLEKVVAGLVVRELYGRMSPVAGRAQDIPAYLVAAEAMKKLGAGEHIFGLVAQRDAGAGMTPITRADVVASGDRQTVNRAFGYYGVRGDRGDRNGCN